MIQILILTKNDLCSFIIFYYLSHHKRKFGENTVGGDELIISISILQLY